MVLEIRSPLCIPFEDRIGESVDQDLIVGKVVEDFQKEEQNRLRVLRLVLGHIFA